MGSIINSFDVKNTLCSLIWENSDSTDFKQIKLKSDIRQNLLEIADLFIESFQLESEVEIEDIHLVGSIANYNWSNYSDIDLHVLIDKSKLASNPSLVDEFLQAKKAIFNDKHNFKIKGFDVELYAQDINEPIESKGIFSVLFNEWVSEPSNDTKEINKASTIKKVKQFFSVFNAIQKLSDANDKIRKIDQLKDKIKKFRKAGLEKHGEYGVENLTFKYLRRTGYMENLNDYKYSLIDKKLSVENQQVPGF